MDEKTPSTNIGCHDYLDAFKKSTLKFYLKDIHNHEYPPEQHPWVNKNILDPGIKFLDSKIEFKSIEEAKNLKDNLSKFLSYDFYSVLIRISRSNFEEIKKPMEDDFKLCYAKCQK